MSAELVGADGLVRPSAEQISPQGTDSPPKNAPSQAASRKPLAAGRKRPALPVDPASFLSEGAPQQRHYIQAFQALPPSAQVKVPLDAISPSSSQPRKVFDPERLHQLASSITEVGVLEPILVRPLPTAHSPQPTTQYQIVIGERRWRAAKEAGLNEIPCLVRQISDHDAFLLALSENIQRDDLTPLEEAEAYHHLIQTGAVLNQSELARRLGVTRARISQKMKLVHLDYHSKEEILHHPGQITEHHAQQLLRIPSLELRHQALDLVLETGISARSLHRRLRQLSFSPLRTAHSALFQVSHRGFSLRIALDLVDREMAVKDLVDAIGRLEALPTPPQPTATDTPLPGLQ